MNELLLNAQRARFWQSSEKQKYVLENGEQQRLFNEAETVQDPKAPEPIEETEVKAHTRKSKRTVDELTEGLPVEKIILDLTEDEQVCGTCRSKLKPIGEKLVRREIETTRKQVTLLEYYTVILHQEKGNFLCLIRADRQGFRYADGARPAQSRQSLCLCLCRKEGQILHRLAFHKQGGPAAQATAGLAATLSDQPIYACFTRYPE